ncbi:hypothetical protein [Streptomyces sp. NPDC102282]
MPQKTEQLIEDIFTALHEQSVAGMGTQAATKGAHQPSSPRLHTV